MRLKERSWGFFYTCWLKLRYRSHIHVNPCHVFSWQSQIIIHRYKGHSGTILIGKGVRFNESQLYATGGEIIIGDDVKIGAHSYLVSHERITIGAKTALAPNVRIYDHNHCFGFNGVESGFRTAPVEIGKHCWIGDGCILLKGARIGDCCVIGAGCVIDREIPSHSLVTPGRNLDITLLREKTYNGEIS